MTCWVDNIIKMVNKFISKFTSVYAKCETLIGEIQTLVPIWETELACNQAMVFQVMEVERFIVLKFLRKIL